MTHFLVTGGAGFVGSHLTEKLLQSGSQVTIIDDFSTGNRVNIQHLRSNPRFSVVEGSILDQPLVDRLVRESDFVFHLAAAVGVFNIVNRPIESLTTNIRGSELVINACVRWQRPFLVTSTSEIYGKNMSQSLNEDDDRILGSPLVGRWTYSEAKAIEEFMAFNAFQEFGVPAKIVRLFNTVGPRQSGEYGMVLPRFINAALRDEVIEIYGSGEQTRCFGHVTDVVEAIIGIANLSSANGKAFNVGNPSEISINDLAKKIISLLNSRSQIRHIDYAEAYKSGFEDMQRRVPDITRIKTELGWTPKLRLEDMILDIAEFERKKL